MAFAETQNLVVKLDLKGDLNAKLGSAARSIQAFDRATSNTQRSLGKFSSNIQRGVAVGIAATGTALLGVVKAASDYESAFAGVRKTVSATEPQLQELSKQFRDLAKTIPISASELARLGEAGGALGVPTDQLKEFVRVTALLGVTTNLTADEAADSLGVLGNVLKLTGDQYSKFASSLVALGNAGASTERDIVAIAERAGAAGELIGVSTEQILGFSSAVASLGIESEAGGTAIQKFFIDSAKAVSGGGAALKVFAKTAGVTGKEFQKAFKEDAGGALQDFLAGLGKLPQAKQLAILEDLGFNDARITRTLLGLANNTALVAGQMDVANKAFKENTALTKEAEQRFNTFDSQVTILKNTLQDVAITVGSQLLPKITPLIKRLADFINLPATQGQIGKFATDLATGFEKFATALGKVDWTPFIDGLRLSADIAKSAIDIFRSLPGPLQAALVGGFALNKLTGGLPTSIAKDIGGTLLNQFAARGSSPANALWVQSVGGPLGAGGVGGKGSGLLGTAGKILGVVGIAEIASILAPTLSDIGASINKGIIKAVGGVPILSQFKPGDLQWPFGNKNAPSWAQFSAPNPLNKIDGLNGGRLQPGDLGVRQTEAMENRTGTVNGKTQVLLDAIRQQLVQANRTLKTSKDPQQIAAAALAAANSITKGAGSASTTAETLAGLKAALRNVHDPKTRAALQAAIKAVERKTPGREFAQRQISKADGILKSNQSTAKKIEDLKAIERALKDRGLPHAANRIREKIDEAKRVQRQAQRATTEAIKDKDMSPTVNVNVSTSTRISVANQIRATSTYHAYGNVLQRRIE